MARQFLDGKKCSNTAALGAKELDATVWIALHEMFSTPGGYQNAVKSYLNSLDTRISAERKALGPIVSEKEELDASKGRLHRSYMAGLIDDDRFEDELDAIQEAEERLDKRAGERPERLESLEALNAEREYWLTALENGDEPDLSWLLASEQLAEDPDKKFIPVWPEIRGDESDEPPPLLERWVNLLNVKVLVHDKDNIEILGEWPGQGPFKESIQVAQGKGRRRTANRNGGKAKEGVSKEGPSR